MSNLFTSRSSVYKQVVYVITLLSVILFASFGIIFRSVNEQYMRNVIHQTGNNIGFLVEGSLYYSMLENDKKALQATLDIIREMPGIDDVCMYDKDDNLVYSSYSLNQDTPDIANLDCKKCHTHISAPFPGEAKTYKVIEENSNCGLIHKDCQHRHLVIKSPILNEPSCYTNACHVHQKEEKILGALVVNIPLENLDDALQESSTDFFILATFTTILFLFFLMIITRKKVRNPLNAIIAASKSVANGDISTRLEMHPGQLDDMRMVSLAFNNMLDKLNQVNLELQNWSNQLEYKVQKKTEELNEAHSELIKSERMASLGRLSSSVAHELNNPLAGVLTYTKLIHKQLSKPNLEPNKKEQLLGYLKVIENETKRCGDIVRGLLDFSRKDQKGFEQKALHDVLNETYQLMLHQMKMANIEFITDFKAKNQTVNCIPNQIKQACVAILVNATEAISDNGEIVFSTNNPTPSEICIEITDNGTGIANEDIPHIFEPFFSAKDKTNGIGLGLAIVHGIIQSHKGKIQVRSERGQGTTFSLVFPIVKN